MQRSKSKKKYPFNEQCAICLDNMPSDSDTRKLRCKHVFHESCISKWLKHKSNCPLCRESESTLSKREANPIAYPNVTRLRLLFIACFCFCFSSLAFVMLLVWGGFFATGFIVWIPFGMSATLLVINLVILPLIMCVCALLTFCYTVSSR